jgi:membrane-bound metal-dependent hydrolase YbcI (DUF457 family)
VDLFTHVLVAYLLSFSLVGFQPAYLAAGAIAGGLPDGDIFLFPLWRRFPILRHHGITHSIFGVTVIAAVGGLVVAPALAPGDPWVYFGIMEAAGLGHMLMDGFTHFSVPPLMPFSDRPLEIDADRAVNFLTLIVSVASFYLLLGVERNHVPFAVYLDTVYALIVFFVAYFVTRLTGRLWVQRIVRAQPRRSVPIPTGNPFGWIVLSESKEGGRMTTTYSRYTLGRGRTLGPLTVSAPLEAAPSLGPVTSEVEALERSYPIARKGSRVLEDTYHFGEARRDPSGCWSVTWFSLEFTAFGRSAATRVEFAADGTASVHRAWYAPRWAALAA